MRQVPGRPLTPQSPWVSPKHTWVSPGALQLCPCPHSLFGGSDYKLIYRHYATLYFVFCVDSSESELGILDLIQVCPCRAQLPGHSPALAPFRGVSCLCYPCASPSERPEKPSGPWWGGGLHVLPKLLCGFFTWEQQAGQSEAMSFKNTTIA